MDRFTALIAVFLVLFVQSAQAEIYKCLGDPENNPEVIRYQDEPCFSGAKAFTELPKYSLIAAPDMEADESRKHRLKVMHLKLRIREEERVLSKLYSNLDKDLAKAVDDISGELQELAQARYEGDYRNAKGLPYKRLDFGTGGQQDNLGFIKAAGQNRIERQKQEVSQLYRQLASVEAKAK